MLAPTSLRPRNKRFISGFEDFAEEDVRPSGNHALTSPYLTPYDSPNHSRAPSPIPSKHPSRSPTPARRINTSHGTPPRARDDLLASDAANDLANSLSGLWGRSWTSLQGLASNVLGSDASTHELFKDKATPRSRRPYEATHHARSDKVVGAWGPRSRDKSQQPGAGSLEDRQAAFRAKKRRELLAASADAYAGTANNAKRRMSDDFESASAPPGEHDDRDVLVYLHTVSKADTLAGISIRYHCNMAAIKKANRLWSNDQILAKKHILLPIDSCGIRGRQVAAPHEAATSGDLLGEEQKTPTPAQAPWTAPMKSSPPASVQAAPQHSRHGSAASNGSQNAPEQAWKHDSWMLLEGFSEPTEMARIGRREMGYFPRGRRKSLAYSDFDTPSTSLDLTRPSVSASESSSSMAPKSRPRRSSSAGQWAQQMQGPGGVGKLGGRGVPVPGPAQDKLNKVFSKHLPHMVGLTPGPNPSAEELVPAPISQGLQKVGGAIEGWMRDLAKSAVKAVEPASSASSHGDASARPFGLQRGPSGDLIELSNAFEVGVDDEDDEDRPSVESVEEERGRIRPPVATGSAAFGGPLRRANGRAESTETILELPGARAKKKGE